MLNARYNRKQLKHINHHRYGPSQSHENTYHTTSNAQTQTGRQSDFMSGDFTNRIQIVLASMSQSNYFLRYDQQSAITNELHSKAEKKPG